MKAAPVKAPLGQRLAWRAQLVGYDALGLLARGLGFGRAGTLGGAVLGWLGPKTSKHRIVLRNLEIAFPELGAAAREQLAADAWRSMGRTFAEFPLTHRLAVGGPHLRVEGAEHMDAVAASGRPAVCVGGHFGNWEVMACVLAQGPLDVAVTYRRINNPHLDRRVVEQRAAYGTELLVPKSGAAGARHLLGCLRRGQSVALLNDQKFNQGESVDFFGEPAMTAPGPSRLAARAGLPILLFSNRREADGSYTVRVEPPFYPQSAEDGLRRTVAWTEKTIREAPAQWFWAHRRWPKEVYRRP